MTSTDALFSSGTVKSRSSLKRPSITNCCFSAYTSSSTAGKNRKSQVVLSATSWNWRALKKGAKDTTPMTLEAPPRLNIKLTTARCTESSTLELPRSIWTSQKSSFPSFAFWSSSNLSFLILTIFPSQKKTAKETIFAVFCSVCSKIVILNTTIIPWGPCQNFTWRRHKRGHLVSASTRRPLSNTKRRKRRWAESYSWSISKRTSPASRTTRPTQFYTETPSKLYLSSSRSSNHKSTWIATSCA